MNSEICHPDSQVLELKGCATTPNYTTQKKNGRRRGRRKEGDDRGVWLSGSVPIERAQSSGFNLQHHHYFTNPNPSPRTEAGQSLSQRERILDFGRTGLSLASLEQVLSVYRGR